MREKRYAMQGRGRQSRKRAYLLAAVAVVIVGVGGLLFTQLSKSPAEKAVSKLQFDNSVSDIEKQAITQAVKDQSQTLKGSVSVHVATTLDPNKSSQILSAYVPVTNVYATKQIVTKEELSQAKVYIPQNTDQKTKTTLSSALAISPENLEAISSYDKITDTDIAFIPADELSKDVKLLTFNDAYYLDSFQKGAVFRQAEFSGNAASSLSGLSLNDLPTKDTTLKVNMTGVTALTRIMMKKLASVNDPSYFSKDIGPFLADADITHVSNEVSFKQGCQYSNTVFCAPPEMIQVLKDSGIDLVELTGNHNNDSGKEYNKETIDLYHSLGWHTFGGGINTTEAAKPYIADQKKSKVAFLGYNYPDSPNGGPIATTSSAGANSFDFDKIKTDIESAKQQSNFVIVDVQFWECFAYPNGYIEMPECYKTITDQKEVFRKIADLGADMVIGTQAHQPQTYELYKGTPIYYGLGNLYFEQTQWPGTEKGVILTHYFANGKLLQTKLSPTVYDKNLQTRLMTNEEAVSLLEKLQAAR